MRPLSDNLGPETLSLRDKVCFLPDVAARLGSTFGGLAAYWFGKRGLPLSPILVPRPTAWTTTAESHSRDVLGPVFYDHSLRTWCFGLALAHADGVALDEELFYVAAMLHDIGLRQPIADRCHRFPHGRAAYARRPGCLLLATRLNPLD